jgi:hypothetical protein
MINLLVPYLHYFLIDGNLQMREEGAQLETIAKLNRDSGNLVAISHDIDCPVSIDNSLDLPHRLRPEPRQR